MKLIMAGLDPAIHARDIALLIAALEQRLNVDARDKRGHDES
jgi:hypothetical protein